MTGATNPTGDDATLAARLDDLGGALRQAAPGPAAEPAAADERAALLSLVGDYLLPRLAGSPEPLLAVLFGLSGTGKSTLVNSLAQEPIAAPSAVRPGTRRAVVWSAPEPARRRRRGPAPAGPPAERVASRHPLAAHLSVVDVPPPELAGAGGDAPAVAEWLAVADLGIHVASAARYADAASWALIRSASDRGLPLLFVINRLPDGEPGAQLLSDYAARLSGEGHLAPPAEVVAVPERRPLPVHGGLPEEAVAGLAARLAEIDPDAARAQALDGALGALASRANRLAEVLAAEGETAAALRAAAGEQYAAAGDDLGAQAAAGELGAGAGADWEDHRDAVTRLVAHAAGGAAQQAAASWDGSAAGCRLLAEQPSLWRHGPGIEQQTAERLEEWLDVLGATARVRYPRMWAVRRRRRLARALRAAALTRDGSAAVADLAGPDAASLIDGARADLAAMLRGALDADATRFFVAAGDPDGAVERAARLGAAARAVAAAVGQP